MKGQMQIQRPSVGIVNAGGEQTSSMVSDVPDLLTVHGALAPGTQRKGIEVVEDATLSVYTAPGPRSKIRPHLNGVSTANWAKSVLHRLQDFIYTQLLLTNHSKLRCMIMLQMRFKKSLGSGRSGKRIYRLLRELERSFINSLRMD
jgi:hypothetical protein